jgi:hypothetical protein
MRELEMQVEKLNKESEYVKLNRKSQIFLYTSDWLLNSTTLISYILYQRRTENELGEMWQKAVMIYIYTSGSQKVRFPILLLPNNFI